MCQSRIIRALNLYDRSDSVTRRGVKGVALSTIAYGVAALGIYVSCDLADACTVPHEKLSTVSLQFGTIGFGLVALEYVGFLYANWANYYDNMGYTNDLPNRSPALGIESGVAAKKTNVEFSDEEPEDSHSADGENQSKPIELERPSRKCSRCC